MEEGPHDAAGTRGGMECGIEGEYEKERESVFVIFVSEKKSKNNTAQSEWER